MQEGRGLGGKKIARVNVRLTNEFEQKLNMLAVACNKKPGELARMLLEYCLDDARVVTFFQNEYCTRAAYRIRLVKDYNADKTEYILYDNQREDLK
jgi:hypothetical protein